MPRINKKEESKKSKKKSSSDTEEELVENLLEEDTKKISKKVAKIKKGQNEKSQNEKQSLQRKEINPKSKIGDLNTQEILSYLIKVGKDSLNPTLANGALRLLKELTGRNRPPPQRFGSKTNRNNYYNNNNNYKNYNRNNSRGPHPSTDNDIYTDQ